MQNRKLLLAKETFLRLMNVQCLDLDLMLSVDLENLTLKRDPAAVTSCRAGKPGQLRGSHITFVPCLSFHLFFLYARTVGMKLGDSEGCRLPGK